MNIGLGGKGNSNDRGNSVKDYVKTDQALVFIRSLKFDDLKRRVSERPKSVSV